MGGVYPAQVFPSQVYADEVYPKVPGAAPTTAVNLMAAPAQSGQVPANLLS